MSSLNPTNAYQAMAERVGRLPILKRSHTARQLLKFGLVGVTNTAWDFLIYIVLTRGFLGFTLYFLVANIFAFLVSVLNSYILNKRWTFRDDSRRYHVQFTKFLLVNVVSVALYTLLLYVFVGRLGMYDLVGKLVAVAVVMTWNFTANKLWTFRSAPAGNLPNNE